MSRFVRCFGEPRELEIEMGPETESPPGESERERASKIDILLSAQISLDGQKVHLV